MTDGIVTSYTKDFIDNAFAAEAAIRTNADTDEATTRADADSAETAARTAADATLTNNLYTITRPASLAILDAGLTASGAAPTRIAFLGSSTTAGWMASDKQHQYVDLLVGKIQRTFPSTSGVETLVTDSVSAAFGTLTTAFGVHGYNAGEAGDTSANYLVGAEITNVAALAPAMVVHMIGANDFYNGTPKATYKANVASVIAAIDALLAKPTVHLLIFTYQREDVPTPVVPWSDYGAALKELADASPNTVAFLDLNAEYVKLGIPAGDPYDVLYTDNIHQNDTGHGLMAELIFRFLALATPPARFARWKRVTSDRFTGGNSTNISGRNADVTMGGTATAWVLDTGSTYAITSGALVQGGTTGVNAASLACTHTDVEVGARFVTRPTGGDSIIMVARKDISGVNPTWKGIRLVVTTNGFQLQYRTIDGVNHSVSGQLTHTDGDWLSMRVEGLMVTVLRNGIPYYKGFIDNAAGLSSGNYVGFVKSTTATFTINDYYVDVL